MEIAFLTHYGVPPSTLSAATGMARRQGVYADEALLAAGGISESHFYHALARHLRLPFVDGDVQIAATICYPEAIHAGLVPLADRKEADLLAAPRGDAIAHLILSSYRGELQSRLAITCPTHLSRLVRAASRERILHESSFGLASWDPALCTKDMTSPRRSRAISGLAVLLLVAMLTIKSASFFCAMLVSAAFFALVLLRIMVTAAALEPFAPPRQQLADRELPIYSIVVTLYREARVVPQLVAALDRIDYPPAKLDIKFVIEEEDAETCAALQSLVRTPGHEIIVAPAGAPRTKPRALNVALPLLRGQLVTIFDAEDIPDPMQLRLAAERFARTSPKVACLQARLAIDNLADGWLPQLFAIEYAALFDVINVGLAELRLALPLGGTSNHFRTRVLRKIGGWDAWNLTEDADLGFRLARFGYRIEILQSTTHEEAPITLKAFVGQRRRWCKGWYQTLLTLCRNPVGLWQELGPLRLSTTALVLLSCVLGPLGGPFCVILLALDVVSGQITWPSNSFQVGAATLWTSVFLAGGPAILWPALLGMKRRRLFSLWRVLPLLPAYYAIICFAAWTSLYDLIKRPYHWCKTEHGLGRRSRGGDPAGRSKPAGQCAATAD